MSGAAPARAPVPIVREDSHFLAAFKPSGWVVQGARPGDNSLLEALREWIRVRDAKPGAAFLAPVHRLDRPVCGIVVLAKRTKAASRLSEEIRAGRFGKVYRAVVEGVPDGGGRIVDRLVWDDDAKRARVARAGGDGKDASLDWTVLSRHDGLAVVEIELHTGRKHQIRAQLAHAGHPVAGDRRYGARRRLPGGIALVSWRLSFRHPVERDEVEVEVPPSLDPVPGWLMALGGA